MKFEINIFIAEGFQEGAGLGTCWVVDNAKPGWQKQLPTPADIAKVIEEHIRWRSKLGRSKR